MAFKVGNQGESLWEKFRERGIAVITYEPLARVDLSNVPNGEPNALWARLHPSQRKSLSRFVFEMEIGDAIYVKDGPLIVGKGQIKGRYSFDKSPAVIDKDGCPWTHYRNVDWDLGFMPIRLQVGKQQRPTVDLLSEEEVSKIESCRSAELQAAELLATEEGAQYTKEAIFRVRNGALIQARKSNSDYRCEICGMSFEARYGPIGKGYIVAHHLRPVSDGPSKTSLADISLLCANCHVMVHMKNPPLTPDELRSMLKPDVT